MKRTRYRVIAGRDVARFSNIVDAYEYAIATSRRYSKYLVEISDKSGLIGQYRDGVTTPEFTAHHQAMDRTVRWLKELGGLT